MARNLTITIALDGDANSEPAPCGLDPANSAAAGCRASAEATLDLIERLGGPYRPFAAVLHRALDADRGARLAERNAEILALRRRWFDGLSNREAAAEIAREIAWYEGTAWDRGDNQLTEPPPSAYATAREHYWRVLRASDVLARGPRRQDHLALAARSIREILDHAPIGDQSRFRAPTSRRMVKVKVGNPTKGSNVNSVPKFEKIIAEMPAFRDAERKAIDREVAERQAHIDEIERLGAEATMAWPRQEKAKTEALEKVRAAERALRFSKAQLAFDRHSRSDLGADGGIEAGAGCRGAPDPGEVEPAQIVVEVFGGDPAASAQEGLDPLMQAVDGLDMQFAADALAGRQVQRLMADAQRGGAGRIAGTSIGDQQGVLAEDRFQHCLDGIGTDGGQDASDGIPGPVGGHQDRHLLMGQAALHRLAATLAGFAIRRIGKGLALFRPLPDPRALVAEQHEGFVGLDDAGQGRIGRFGGKKAMAPPESGADRHATAFGRGDNRIALTQRPAELEPALLLPQPGQRGAGQRVEALAALLAAEPPHAVRCAATDRRAVTAMRAPALIAQAPLDCRRHRRARRSPRQHLLKLKALIGRQVVNLRKPRPKGPVLHENLHQNAAILTDSAIPS